MVQATRSTNLHAGNVVSLDEPKRLAGQWWVLSSADGARSATTYSMLVRTQQQQQQQFQLRQAAVTPQAVERIQQEVDIVQLSLCKEHYHFDGNMGTCQVPPCSFARCHRVHRQMQSDMIGQCDCLYAHNNQRSNMANFPSLVSLHLSLKGQCCSLTMLTGTLSVGSELKLTH